MRYIRTFLLIIAGLCVTFFLWFLTTLGPMLPALPYYFHVAGGPFTQKTYLVLLQNNAEMRSTGGFISSFARLQFTWGIPTSIQVKDVFSLKGFQDEVIDEAPYPMDELLAADTYKGYSFHDANWNPDPSTSAKDILDFYKAEFPDDRIDGLIFLNFSTIEHLLTLVEPISLEGKEVVADTLFHTIQYEQNNIDRHDVTQLQNRKSILSTLLPAFQKKLLLSPHKYAAIFSLLNEELKNKNITLYFTDQGTQDIFRKFGYTHDFPQATKTQTPFIVVESNLGGMKSDRYLRRSYEQKYILPREPEKGAAQTIGVQTKLTFTHNGAYNPPLSHEYIGYIRTYIPVDAQDIIWERDFTQYEENGFTVLGEKIRLAPGDSISLTYSYSLPAHYIHDNTFTTYLFQQSGLENTTYAVDVIADTDHLLTSKEYHVAEQVASYTTDTPQGDKLLQVQISEDTTPPRVTNQAFLDYNRLSVQFHEPVLASDCKNIENYIITDKDVHVPDVTNYPKIKEIRCTPQEAIIFTQNIRTQYNEHFQIELRNIRDRANNIIAPNPLHLTVVQRFKEDIPEK